MGIYIIIWFWTLEVIIVGCWGVNIFSCWGHYCLILGVLIVWYWGGIFVWCWFKKVNYLLLGGYHFLVPGVIIFWCWELLFALTLDGGYDCWPWDLLMDIIAGPDIFWRCLLEVICWLQNILHAIAGVIAGPDTCCVFLFLALSQMLSYNCFHWHQQWGLFYSHILFNVPPCPILYEP